MKISPYISFNGNCAQAVAFYAQALSVEPEIMHYKDAPPENGYESPKEEDELIMHAQLTIGGETMMFCDVPTTYPVTVGTNFAVMAEFDTQDAATAAFNALKDGGDVGMELQKTFWSEWFGSLIDKFGVAWNISIGCPKD
jgi:PhnB protein